MASGFLILPDGRCFARNWAIFDATLLAVAEHLEATSVADEFRDWLLGLVPGPNDEAHVGYGPWFRAADQVLVERYLDLRELTPENQRLLCQAARLAALEQPSCPNSALQQLFDICLADLADMIARVSWGETPLSRSDWREVVPSRDRKLGPGWKQVSQEERL